MTDDAPITFVAADGRVLLARDHRRFRDRDDRIAALVRSLFSDAGRKSKRDR